VRQGYLLSPNIFNAVLEEIFRIVRWKGKGFRIKTRGSNLFEFSDLIHLRFAEDVVLIGKNARELSEMVGDLGRI